MLMNCCLCLLRRCRSVSPCFATPVLEGKKHHVLHNACVLNMPKLAPAQLLCETKSYVSLMQIP